MITFFIFKRPIIVGWGRDMGMILQPIQISIRIYGWRLDRPVHLIKIENLRPAHSVSTIGSSQSVSNTQSEFVALQQHTTYLTENYKQLLVNYEQHMAHLTEKYEQFLVNYEQLRQMVMNMTS